MIVGKNGRKKKKKNQRKTQVVRTLIGQKERRITH